MRDEQSNEHTGYCQLDGWCFGAIFWGTLGHRQMKISPKLVEQLVVNFKCYQPTLVQDKHNSTAVKVTNLIFQ